MSDTMYAIVQHSGAGYAGKPGFVRGLETRRVTRPQAETVVAEGGVVFASWSLADEYADYEAYPPGTGIYPNAPGAFLRKKIDGLPIYVPRVRPAEALTFAGVDA